MNLRDLEHQTKTYLLGQEKKEAMGRLATLLTQANREQLHEVLGMQEGIRYRDVDDNPGYRTTLKLLLQTHLSGESGKKIPTKTRKLIQDIVDGIVEVDSITAKMESDDEEGQEPAKDEDSKVKTA